MIGVQPRRRVEMIVVQRDDLAIPASDLEEGVHRGAKATRRNLRDNGLTGFSLHLEDIPVARAVHAPVNDDGKSHFLRLGRGVVGFLLHALGQRVQGERHSVGNDFPVGGGNQVLPRFRVLRRQHQRRLFQVPAGGLDLDRLAHTGAQREDAGHEGQLTDGNAIHEAFTAAEERLVNGQKVVAVFGDHEMDQRVRV